LFNKTFGDQRVGNLLPLDIENLQVDLREKRSPSYIDQVIDTARYMVTKALDNDIIGGDCLKPFRRIKPLLKRGV